MCGIAGILDRRGDPVSRVILGRMSEAVAHRGPDGDGTTVIGCAGLAHRRLAIIDLSAAGHQPMATRDGRFTLTYNGEVYNHTELRLELEALGRTFRSRTDSEVVLEALAIWGPAAIARFNGIFALALWDRDERALLLARDRCGVKPLYWAEVDGTILFASEIKAILTHPAYRVDMDLAALKEYLTFQNVFTDRTLFAGVRLLPAGCTLSVGVDERSPSVRRYWDWNFVEPEKPLAREEYVEELDRLFRQAVSRQLMSDVPVGAYLSGGVDSGSITAIAAAQLPEMRTFTVGFDVRSASGIEIVTDERSHAEYLSYLVGSEHYEMVLKAGDMERALPAVVRHLEDLRVGQSYPNYYAAKLAGSFGKVVLSGAGGDEIFCGYPWRYRPGLADQSFDAYCEAYYAYWQRMLDDASLAGILAPVAGAVADVDTRAIFRDLFTERRDDLRPEDYVNHSLHLEARTFLHGLLVVEDKLSMAHGLESRVPFLDNDLVDFAMTVPVSMKLGRLEATQPLTENSVDDKQPCYEATGIGKLILRDVLRRYVPEQIADRRKQGFSAPDATWFRGESIDFVRRRLYSDRALLWDFLDRRAVRSLLDDHLNGMNNRRLLIWSLLCLEEWCRAFLGRSGVVQEKPSRLREQDAAGHDVLTTPGRSATTGTPVAATEGGA